MIFAEIKNTKLLSARVFTTKPRNIKSIHYKGFFYEYVQKKNHYSLELYLAQVSYVFNVYDMVFIQSADASKWIGVFINSTRKSIAIENDVFEEHLRRYYFITAGKLAIINGAIETDLENVEFISIEKHPQLIDPSKQVKSIAKAFAGLAAALLLLITANFMNNTRSEEFLALQKQNIDDSNKLYEIIKVNKEITPPSKKEQMDMLALELKKFGS